VVFSIVRQHGGSAMVIQDMDQTKRTIILKESIAGNLVQKIEREYYTDSQSEQGDVEQAAEGI
jgi:hypothetical protein